MDYNNVGLEQKSGKFLREKKRNNAKKLLREKEAHFLAYKKNFINKEPLLRKMAKDAETQAYISTGCGGGKKRGRHTRKRHRKKHKKTRRRKTKQARKKSRRTKRKRG